MTDSGGWPGDETAATEILALPSAERHVLAAVAVVGGASLSESELADLVELEDVRPLIDDLERRGLIKGDERKRYSLLGNIGEEIRKTDDALATGDQLMQYLKTLADAGSVSPARLAEDAQAILGLSEWAAEYRQWATLLEFVKTVQAAFGIAQRVQQWLVFLEHGRRAAHALGDRRSEVWIVQQMAMAAQSAGDVAAARRYLREADELQRGHIPAGPDGPRPTDDVTGSGHRLVWWILGLAATAAVGVGIGYAIGHHGGTVGATTTQVRVTATVNGGTVTSSHSVTLPAATVTSVSTVTVTTTDTTQTTAPVIP